MKKFFSLITILSLASIVQSQALKLDEILLKYYKATGIENLAKSKTITMSGLTIRENAMPVKIIKKQPDKFRMEYDVQDMTSLQVYNGQVAWGTMPWTGNAAPQQLPEDRAKDLKARADYQGLLYNWKTKGHLAELIGTEKIDNIEVYKIKLTRKDGAIEYYFIDSQKFLLLKQLSFRKVQGKDVEVEFLYSDFRNVKGVIFPFAQKTKMGGQPYSEVEYETIELDNPVDDKIFDLPGK